MENNKVLIGSIIFVFASFIGMMVLFVYETAKSKRELEAFIGRPSCQSACPAAYAHPGLFDV